MDTMLEGGGGWDLDGRPTKRKLFATSLRTFSKVVNADPDQKIYLKIFFTFFSRFT